MLGTIIFIHCQSLALLSFYDAKPFKLYRRLYNGKVQSLPFLFQTTQLYGAEQRYVDLQAVPGGPPANLNEENREPSRNSSPRNPAESGSGGTDAQGGRASADMEVIYINYRVDRSRRIIGHFVGYISQKAHPKLTKMGLKRPKIECDLFDFRVILV